jgi:hypothetical protein
MGFLTEAATWAEGLYRIELTDPVEGGESGIDNVQAKTLGARTRYLKAILDVTVADIAARLASISVSSGNVTHTTASTKSWLVNGGGLVKLLTTTGLVHLEGANIYAESTGSIQAFAPSVELGGSGATTNVIGTLHNNGSPVGGGGSYPAATLTTTGTIAGAGTVRLPNAATVQARNAANSSDVQALEVDSSNVVKAGTTSNPTEVVGSTTTVKSAGDINWRPTGATTDSLKVAVVSSETKLTTPAAQGWRNVSGGNYITDTGAGNGNYSCVNGIVKCLHDPTATTITNASISLTATGGLTTNSDSLLHIVNGRMVRWTDGGAATRVTFNWPAAVTPASGAATNLGTLTVLASKPTRVTATFTARLSSGNTKTFEVECLIDNNGTTATVTAAALATQKDTVGSCIGTGAGAALAAGDFSTSVSGLDVTLRVANAQDVKVSLTSLMVHGG